MRRFYILTTLSGLVTFGAMAQDEPALIKMKIETDRVAAMAAQAKIVGVRSALLGSTVKNAPYSATELTESNQVLADGTRIHNETRTMVYRDSEGRLRRETPNEVTIWDPVANASYVLNPQTMTARRINVSTFSFTSAGGGGRIAEFRSVMPGTVLDQAKSEVARKLVTEQAELAKKMALETKTVDVVGVPTEASHVVELHATTVAGEAGQSSGHAAGTFISTTASPTGNVMVRRIAGRAAVTDALGKQMMEGVNADGTRITSTIETGEIGNDRPLKIISERWYSSELQTLIMSKQTDPRTGEESFRLMNVSRSEPAAYLFQVPAAYQVLDK